MKKAELNCYVNAILLGILGLSFSIFSANAMQPDGATQQVQQAEEVQTLADRFILPGNRDPEIRAHQGIRRYFLDFSNQKKLEIFLSTFRRQQQAGQSAASTSSVQPNNKVVHIIHFMGNGERAEIARPDEQILRSAVEGSDVFLWTLNYPGYGQSTGPSKLAYLSDAARTAFDAVKSYDQRIKGSNSNIQSQIWVSGSSIGTAAALSLVAVRDVDALFLRNPPELQTLVDAKASQIANPFLEIGNSSNAEESSSEANQQVQNSPLLMLLKLGSGFFGNFIQGLGAQVRNHVPDNLSSIANIRSFLERSPRTPVFFLSSENDSVVSPDNQRSLLEVLQEGQFSNEALVYYLAPGLDHNHPLHPQTCREGMVLIHKFVSELLAKMDRIEAQADQASVPKLEKTEEKVEK